MVRREEDKGGESRSLFAFGCHGKPWARMMGGTPLAKNGDRDLKSSPFLTFFQGRGPKQSLIAEIADTIEGELGN